MRVRGVIRLSVVRSPRLSTRFIILRSSASITPCSWLSDTSSRISSSLISLRASSLMPSMRRTARLIEPSTNTAGLAARASPASTIATELAIFSGLVSARRLGISSPKITLAAVIRVTAVPMPSGRAYSIALPGSTWSSQPAMARPIDSPPKVPVSTPIAVMPICTVDSRLSGCSASCSAVRAPRLGWVGFSAICFRRSLREVISAISDIAKKALRMIRAMTITSSSIGNASCGRWVHGRSAYCGRNGPERTGQAEVLGRRPWIAGETKGKGGRAGAGPGRGRS